MSNSSSMIIIGLTTVMVLCGAAIGIATALNDSSMTDEQQYNRGYSDGYAAGAAQWSAENPDGDRLLISESPKLFLTCQLASLKQVSYTYISAYDYGYDDGWEDGYYGYVQGYSQCYQNYVDYMEEYNSYMAEQTQIREPVSVNN